jgi:hypothetical protein
MTAQDKNKDKDKQHHTTGKPDPSKPKVEQTENEADNKGIDKVHPELTEEKEELKKAPDKKPPSR